MLVEYDANIDAIDKFGYNRLFYAKKRKNRNAVELLIREGANKEYVSDPSFNITQLKNRRCSMSGFTVIHVACWKGHLHILQFFQSVVNLVV